MNQPQSRWSSSGQFPLAASGVAVGRVRPPVGDRPTDDFDLAVCPSGDVLRYINDAVLVGQNQEVHESEAGFGILYNRTVINLVEDFREH